MDAFHAEAGIGWEEALVRLAQIGSDAVPALTNALDTRKKQRWQIACALGRIGPTRAASAIPALRRHANDESTGGNWCSMVLGFLGDSAFAWHLQPPLARPFHHLMLCSSGFVASSVAVKTLSVKPRRTATRMSVPPPVEPPNT